MNIKLSNLLVEHYINIFDDKEKEKYIDVVWDILERTYAPIGWFQSAATKQELINKSWLWKLVRKNDKIVAVAIYKDKQGRKAIAKGSDGSDIGKKAVKKIYLDDASLKDRNSWGEFSGAAEKLMLKYGGIPVPNYMVKNILNDKKILSYNSDGFHYTRIIGDTPREKIIIGNIKK